MLRIVIDTNIIVSALIQKSYPYKIIYEMLLEDKFEFCLSDEILLEYYEVLARPKFGKFEDFFIKAESVLASLESKASKFVPKIKLDLILDVDDNKILELAHECEADYIITGNTKDFTFSNYKTTKIVTPKEFWEIMQNL